MSPRPERVRPSGSSPLKPEEERLQVGDSVGKQKPPATKPRTRVPFGSYMNPDLQKRFKASCVLAGIEMQDALEEAIEAWLAAREALVKEADQALEQEASQQAS